MLQIANHEVRYFLDGAVLTTQLFFPGVARNRTDSIFTAECLVQNWRVVKGRRLGRFDFVLAS